MRRTKERANTKKSVLGKLIIFTLKKKNSLKKTEEGKPKEYGYFLAAQK